MRGKSFLSAIVLSATAAFPAPANAFDLAQSLAWDQPRGTSETAPRGPHAGAPRFGFPSGSAGRLFDLVTQAALRHGIRPALAHAVVRIESNYNCRAHDAFGSIGIMQVKPATARAVGVTGNLRDCATGLEAGMRYLRQALAAGGTGCPGISLYQLGIYARPRCTAYGRRVLALSGES